MKLFQKGVSLLLVLAMLLSLVPATALASNEVVTTNEQGNYEIINEQSETTEVDESWEEDHPYGMLALGHHQVITEEGGATQILKVHRLGGTVGKVSAIIQYAPAVVETKDGGEDLAYAISPEDVRIEVEDPLPITEYQAWGEGPAPEPARTGISARMGVDEVLGQCTILSANTLEAAEDYEWFALYAGNWTSVENSNVAELPVGDELSELDYRCEYTVNGVRYCTDSYRGVAYEKPEPQIIPEAPADLELNPEKTYTEMDLSQGNGVSAWLFEVCFAEGETEKEIRITALEDELPEVDEMATFTIVDHIGGEIMESLNTAMMTISDNDADKDPPAQFGFTVTEATFDKSEGTACLTVQRTGGLVKTMSVDWTLEDGTAVAGVDYAAASGSLNFYGNETQKVIEIPLINDQVEDLTQKEFTVRLSNLKGNGTDASCITEEASVCTVRLYNSNTAEDINLASALQNSAQGVDVSASLTESDGAKVSAQVLDGTQVDGNLPVEDNTTVEWGGEVNPNLRMYQYNNGGKIIFSGGDWSSTVKESLSISSDGKGTNTTTKKITNMAALYRRITASVKGGAKFASGWDRMWYGNKEYAYTYFSWDPYWSSVYNGYKDCDPKYSKSGVKINLSYYNPFSMADDLRYETGEGTLTLGVGTYESRPSDGNINASADVTLTRRTFSNDFKLNIYTANDPDTTAEVAKYADSDYSSIIKSVSITNGGTNGGKLYIGSSVQIQLGDTHLSPVSAYLVDASGNTVATGTLSGATATFNNLILNPTGSYTFRLVLDRTQDIKIDVSTSANLSDDGSYADGAFDAAYELLLENSETDLVTVGYTARNGNNFDSTVSEKSLNLSGRTLTKGMITLEKVTNLQWINFNMPEDDVFIFNGTTYQGNEKIPLDIANIKTNNLQFYYYAAQYKSMQRPMNATLDATAVYYDGNANGKIDGYFDRATGSFVLDEASGDEFVAFPEDGDYAEPMFSPVVGEDGKVHQYFFRAYYTANPVSFVAPTGKENEKMQVMPAFITDVTDPVRYASMTQEQQQYRVIVSGETSIKESADVTITGYSADNHAKYGAEASVYSYVDIPLGGDASTAMPVTSDLPDGRYTIDGQDCMVNDGFVYAYGANAPDNLDRALYTWEPNYQGNLLYPFAAPEDIVLPNTMVGDEYPLKGEDLVNGYLGSFGDSDTFALMLCEQEKTTDEILAGRNLRASTGNDETGLKETITRGTVGSFPNPEYLSHMGSTPTPGQNADNSEYTEYDEITVDTRPDLFAASPSFTNFAKVTTSGDTITVSVGIPMSVSLVERAHNRKDPGTNSGNTSLRYNWEKNFGFHMYEDLVNAGSRIKDFVKGIKDGKGGKSFAELYGEELLKNKLHFSSLDFNITVSFVAIIRYNALDNAFKFEQGVLALHLALTLKLRYRFTPVPAIYVFSVISIEGGGQLGLNRLRKPVFEPAVISKDSGQEVTLYTSPEGDQMGSYSFTADKKAFQIKFKGKLKVECFNFNDANENGVYDAGDTLGEAVDTSIFKAGKISSNGREPVDVEIRGRMNGFTIDPVVVKLTPVMESASDATSATISELAEIKSMKNDYAFSGVTLDIGGSIELGVGVGMELFKGEIFGQASVGIIFTLFSNAGVEEYDEIVFNEFTVRLALAFRIVILGFSYEQDLISYTVGYDEELDDNGQGVIDSSGWYHSWSALGDSFGGKIQEFSLRHRTDASDEQIKNYVNLPQKAEPMVSTNGVAGANQDVPQFYAFDTNANDFQVSGYGSGSNAFRLMQGGDTGYDYQIVTVEDRNYVIYTGANPDASAVDNTELWLSRLEETDDVYGYVNPIAENGTDAVPYIPVDGDGTGDLEFYAWAEGTKIHALWVSYADATSDEALAEGEVSQHLKNSAYNTVVKHAVFDTADTEATGFGTPEILSAAEVNAYYFQPHMAGGAAVVARSVPYSDEALETRMAEYEQYLMDTADEVTGEQDPNGYMAASREFRLSYQRDLAAVYGGNSVLSVSVPGRELTNSTAYISTAQAADPAQANEIITNLDMTEIDGVYYLSYMTQQDIFERDGEIYTDLASTYRFYLRTFTIDENDAVVWGEPYLLRTLVNREQSGEADGVYSGGALTTPYQDPGFANLQFLSGRLGDSLKGTAESFRTASAAEVEDFLLFEMNGDTYVIQEASLKSITGNDGTDTHTGTLSPFFTAKQFYESAGHDISKARENGESLASGKGEVVIGADGDGNLAAVYTAAMPNTVNNAIYISYWDPGTGSWSDGVMLAMNHMDVYERAAAEDWDDENTKAAYYDEEKGGGLDQFTFSNLQIALGRKSAEEGETTQTPEGDEIHNETTADDAETTYADLKEQFNALLQGNGVTQAQIDAWFADGNTVPTWLRDTVYESAGQYALTQQAEAMDLAANSSASAAELLILTQGTMQRLDKYEDSEGNVTVAPARDEDGSVLSSSVGIYAISYGKGNQQVGDVSISFSEHDFSAGNVLDANVAFANVGDAAIRGSKDQPVKVHLMLSDNGTASEMAYWEIKNNISAGQKVELDTGSLHCAPLPGDLGFGDFFYITVAEDAAYIESTGGEAYYYDSSADPNHGCTFDIEIKPELAIENMNASVFAVDKEGNPILHITFDTANRGSLMAKDPWLQFSYAASYDEEGEPIYAPLDMTNSELYISRQMQIKEETDLRSAGINNLRLGIVMLRGTEIFNRQNYYLTEEEYNQILARYYTTYPVSYWDEGEYRGQSYWYDTEVYESAQAAFEAGSAAVAHLKYDWRESMYYANTYSSLAEAKRAAEADCKAEYILTAQQYSRLSLEEQSAWHPVICVDDGLTYYVPNQIKTYEGAWLVYQAALKELNHNLFSHFYRQVEAYVKVSPEMFNAPLNESLNLRVELFSDDTSTSYDGSTGLYRSDHAGEYNAVNNAATVALEQTGFILAPHKVTLNDMMVHYLPVHIRTTTGEAPQIRVLEVVEEGQEKKLSTLYYTPNGGNTHANVVSGYLTVMPGSSNGTGIIHIIDESTNTTHAITYHLGAMDQFGINFSREDPMIFRNADGTANTEESTTDEWTFPYAPSGNWRELGLWVDDRPWNDDIAVGKQGASVSFFTTSNQLEFYHWGTLTVSSSKFNASFLSGNSGTTNAEDGTATIKASTYSIRNTVSFDGPAGELHKVTVTVASEEATLDHATPSFYTTNPEAHPNPDAPGIYWSRSFPKNGVSLDDSIYLTAYVFDEAGLQNLYRNGEAIGEGQIRKYDDNLWSYSITVDVNGPRVFQFGAKNVNGGETFHEAVTYNWYEYGGVNPDGVNAPNSGFNVYKGDYEFLYNQNSGIREPVYILPEDAEQTAKFWVSLGRGHTDESVEVYYYQYDAEADDFVEIPSDNTVANPPEITENGYYMTRVVQNSDGAWDQKVILVDCFETRPELEVSNEYRDGKYYLNWSASKDPESTATLESVTVNGYELLKEQGLKSAQGSEELPFGGDYTVKVTDSKGITAKTTLHVDIPVTFPADAITVVDNWSANPLYHRGEAHIDLPKLSGGAYDPTKITKNGHALPPKEYTGSYGYFQMVVNGPTEEFSVEDEIIRWIDDIMWRNVEEGPVGALKTANHIIVLQSIYDQKNPELIAWQFITVRDNQIKISSINATPSLGTANQDGSIRATFEGGHTGKYEAAILPGKTLTIDDFKASDVVWKSAEDDGTVTFENLTDGTWQLAVRARYDDDPNAYQSVNANDWHGAVISDPIVVADGEMTADEAVQAAKEAQLAAEAAQLAAEKAAADARVAQAAAEEAAKSAAADKTAAENAKLAAEQAKSQAEAAKAAAETAQSKAEAAQLAAEASNAEAAKEAAAAAQSAKDSAEAASAAAGSASEAAQAAEAAQDAQSKAEAAQKAAEDAAASSAEDREGAQRAQAAAELAQVQAEAAKAAAEAAQSKAEEAQAAAEAANVKAAEEAAKSAQSSKESAESAAAAAGSAADAAEAAKASQDAQAAAEVAQAAAEQAASSAAVDKTAAESAKVAAEQAKAQAEAAKATAEAAQSMAEEAQAAAEAANVKAAEEAAKSAQSSKESAEAASAAAGSAADAAIAAKAAQDAQSAAETAKAAAEKAAADSETNKEAAEAAQTAAETAQSQAEAAKAAAEAAKTAADESAKAAESSNVEAAQQAAASAASAKASAESAASAAKSAAEAAASAIAAQSAQKAAETAKTAAEAAQLAAEAAQSKAEAALAAAEAAAASSAEDREGAEAAQKASELAQAQAEAAKAAAEAAQSKAEEAQKAAEAANVKAAEEAAKSAQSSKESAEAASAAAGSAADAAEAAKAAQDAQAAAEAAQVAAEAAAASSAENRDGAEAAQMASELAKSQAEAAKIAAEDALADAETAAAAAESSNVKAAEEAAKSAASAKEAAQSASVAALYAKEAADSAKAAQEAAQKAKEEADRIAFESALNLAKTVALIELNELAQELLPITEEEYRSALSETAKAQREILLAAADEAALAEALEAAKLALTKIAARQCAAVVFGDVTKDAWYHEAVDYVLNEGMMNGNGNGNFAPNEELNRAMLVQILYNIEGRPEVDTELEFSDVSQGVWYYDAVMWAAENGIVNGTGNGKFAPALSISREQMVTILYRYAGSPELTATEITFNDAESVSSWAKLAVIWAAELGIVKGVGDNTFQPGGSSTRATAAQIMLNYFKR